MDTIGLVKEFHETFGHPIGTTPQIPAEDIVDFRVKFIAEEMEELCHAVSTDNLVEFADGLGDLQYVLDGFFLNAGLQDKKEAIMVEIHRSNMSKVCKTAAEGIETIKRLIHPMEITSLAALFYEIKKVGDYYVVYRKSDNKIMKSINYSRPNLHPIIHPTNLS